MLEAASRCEIEWLMINIPPGTGKSELVSRLWPSYLARIAPWGHVAIVSYGKELAAGMCRDAREYFEDGGGRLHHAQAAKSHWMTEELGEVWAAGFGGAVRGRRYHWGIIDDPHKDPEELESDIKRERFFRFWDKTWMNRAHMFSDNPIVRAVVMQRLADNDLCGWLLGRPDSDKWTVLSLDAEHSLEPYPEQDRATFLPDPRAEGELLMEHPLFLQRIEDNKADEDAYLAQFQQRPRKVGGTVINADAFRTCLLGQTPPLLGVAVGVDLAVSKKQVNDYTVAFAIGVGIDKNYYIFRPARGRWTSPESRRHVAAYGRRHGASAVGVESVAFQLAFVQELQVMPEMAGFPVVDVAVDLDKVARAKAWAFLVDQGRMFLVEDGSNWPDVFRDECKKFPRAKHDDQIDAIGIAMYMVRQLGLSAKSKPMTGGSIGWGPGSY